MSPSSSYPLTPLDCIQLFLLFVDAFLGFPFLDCRSWYLYVCVLNFVLCIKRELLNFWQSCCAKLRSLQEDFAAGLLSNSSEWCSHGLPDRMYHVSAWTLWILKLKLPFDRWVGDMKVESVGNRLWEFFDSSNGNLPFFTRRGSLSLPVSKIKSELKTHGCDTPGENPRCSDGSGQNGLPGYDLKQAASLEVLLWKEDQL